MATFNPASDALARDSIKNPARAAFVAMMLAQMSPCMAANETEAAAARTDGNEQWAVHGQFTYVEQDTNAFSAPYAGRNSLTPSQGRETTDATLYLGTRLWRDAEMWVSPELDQGFGLDDTVGLAGFPSGEAYKIGKNQPYLRLPRAFVRQTVNADDDLEAVDADLLQLGGSRSANRWVFTVGKFSVTDVFDTNQYAHDPRNDFLNWAAVDAGTFDYAADAWGYTVGAAAEWYHDSWTLRSGWFDLSDVPNSPQLDPGGHEFQLVEEVEKRFEIASRPGRLLVTVFDSRGRMGLLDEAVQHAQATGEAVISFRFASIEAAWERVSTWNNNSALAWAYSRELERLQAMLRPMSFPTSIAPRRLAFRSKDRRGSGQTTPSVWQSWSMEFPPSENST